MGAPVWSLAEADWPLAIAVGVACGLAGLALIYAGVSTVRQIEDDMPSLGGWIVQAIIRRIRPAGSPWVCATCRSVNPGPMRICYSCHLVRGSEPAGEGATVEEPDLVPVFDHDAYEPLVPVMAPAAAVRSSVPRRPRRPAGRRHVRHLSRSRHRRPTRLTPPSGGG